MEAVPSTLGSGYRYYLICPVSGRRATLLFLREGTGMLAHRLAYGPTRLFYDSQLEPKLFRGLGVYYGADRAWEKEYRKAARNTTEASH